jgi:hypothetical protein
MAREVHGITQEIPDQEPKARPMAAMAHVA